VMREAWDSATPEERVEILAWAAADSGVIDGRRFRMTKEEQARANAAAEEAAAYTTPTRPEAVIMGPGQTVGTPKLG